MRGTSAALGRGRTLGQVLLVAALYAVAGFLMLYAARFTGLAAPMWPAAGLAFAAVYARGRALAWGVALGSFAVNWTTLQRGEVSSTALLVTAAVIAVGAALQALAGDGLVRRFVGHDLTLDSAGRILAFLSLAGPVACMVNATFGVSVELATGVIPRNDALLGWVTWWAGDAAGVIVFAPIVLMLLPDRRDTWDGRRWKVAVPSLLASVVLLGGFVFNRAIDAERVTLRQHQVADQAVDQLDRAMTRADEALQGIGSFHSSSQFVTADEFRVFTARALVHNPSLQALSWNPVVRADQLAAFEERQRAQPGMAGFSVTEKDASGQLVPVSPRPEYVVVAYIEPLPANHAALGFDIASNPVREAAVEAARDTGELASTAPLELVQETGTQKGILLLQPVYEGGSRPPSQAARRAAIVGYATGVVRIGDLVSTTFAGSQWDDIALTLTDVTVVGQPVQVGFQPAREGGPTAAPFVVRFDINGREWELGVAFTAAAMDHVESASVPVLLLASVLVLGLLEAFLLLVTGLERRARRDAAAYGYEAVHDPLTDLLNRRGFLRALRGARERTTLDGSEHHLMYLDLDGFRDVNNRGGHEAGDELLRQVARALVGKVRRGDSVGRIGGDEFAVLLVDCGEDHGTLIAEQIVAAVAEALVDDLGVTVSVGAVQVTADSSSDVDTLLRAADEACFEAKHHGGDQVRVHVAPS